MARSWSESEDQLLTLYAAGKIDAASIAEITGRSFGSVVSRAHKIGRTRRVWNKHLQEDLTAETVAYYTEQGMTIAQVCNAVHLSYHHVRKCLRSAGVITDRHRAALVASSSQRRELGYEEQEKARALWKKGLTIQDIANEVGCCSVVLRRAIKLWGVTRSRKEMSGAISTRRYLADEDMKQLGALATTKGLNRNQLCHIFGAGWSTLRRHLTQAGIDTVEMGKRKAALRTREAFSSGARTVSPRVGVGIKTPALTPFQGLRLMRSRTEARWANELNRQGIAWFYEAFRYPLCNGTCYTPDFWITCVPLSKAKDLLGASPSKQSIRDFLCTTEHRVEDTKGWWGTTHPSFEKIQQFQQQYPHIPFQLRIEKHKKDGWILWQ